MKTPAFLATCTALALGAFSLTAASAASAWVETPEPNAGALFSVAALTDSDVWAVGFGYGSPALTLTQHWDGSAWSVVPSPNPSTKANTLVGVTAIASNDVWAAGTRVQGRLHRTLIEHWNGTAWSVVPSPTVDPAYSDYIWNIGAITANDVWAVGETINAADVPLTLHWDGTAWSIVPTPAVAGAALFAVSGTASDDVWAVGRAGTGTLTMHWDGASWSVVPSPSPSSAANRLADVVALAPGNAWAVGIAGLNGVGDGLTMHWDGAAWTVVPVPPQADYSQFTGVAAQGAKHLTLVGSIGLDAAVAEDFNGRAWRASPLPPLHANAELHEISVSREGTLWAVGGQYEMSQGNEQLILMRPR